MGRRGYAQWCKDFQGEAFQKGIDAYRIQRILPAVVVHYCFQLFHIRPTDHHIIRAFAALNIGLITLVAGLWCGIARQLKISNGGKWLGFCGLILNFAVLKNASFNPVLTDITAFAAATLLMYFYLRRQHLALYVTLAASAFVWPTLLIVGSALAMFPRKKEFAEQGGLGVGVHALACARPATIPYSSPFDLRHGRCSGSPPGWWPSMPSYSSNMSCTGFPDRCSASWRRSRRSSI